MGSPVPQVQQVLEEAAKKELAWLHAYWKPRLPFDRAYLEVLSNYQKVDPKEYCQSLETFLNGAKHLVPEEIWLQRPVIRHPDLTLKTS